MTYHSTADAVQDLEKNGHLVRIQNEVNPYLEMAAIHRRVYDASGPAILFEQVKGSPFSAVSNMFGTMERARFLFRNSIESVKSLISVRSNAALVLKSPSLLFKLPLTAFQSLPKPSVRKPVLWGKTSIDKLPAITSWPLDGGPFITLPQVYTEDPEQPTILKSNLGMYRIQLSGNQYKINQQVGLHYQIHRGIGIHHQKAIQKNEPLRVSIFVGGPPAHSLAAVMPLPEGLPEVAFAGALAGRSFRYTKKNGYTISSDADFCIVGTVEDSLLPEGPFGDHLGYYSLQHDFPVLKVEAIYHRKNAIWPFTVVGRPPAEDTIFGELIHELTGPMVPVSLPGLQSMYAVDESGVHPLLLAKASERYTPYTETKRPQEILTVANAILGFGQASLAKYVMIASNDAPDPTNVEEFFDYCLARLDFRRDLHFQTNTTIDTLDYSGTGLNQGSKLVMACAPKKLRSLCTDLPSSLKSSVYNWRLVRPGVVAVEAPPSNRGRLEDDLELQKFIRSLEVFDREYPSAFQQVAFIIVCDDPSFLAKSFSNFIWVTFTRSNPAQDVQGLYSEYTSHHWGCSGPLVIDARLKKHLPPPLEEDPKIIKKIDRYFQKGGPLEKWG